MVSIRRDTAVSLRRLDGGVSYLPSHPVSFRNGRPEPVEYEGRRYSFLRVMTGRDYGATSPTEVYVFTERR